MLTTFSVVLRPAGIELDVAVVGTMISPGTTSPLGTGTFAGTDRIMDGDQLGAVGKRPLDLDHRHEIARRRACTSSVVSSVDAEADEIGDRAPLAGALQDFVDDEGNRFRDG